MQEWKRSSERDQQAITSLQQRAQANQSDHDHAIQTANQQVEKLQQQLHLAQSANEDLNVQLTRRIDEINTLRSVEKDSLAAQQQQVAELQTALSNAKAGHEKALAELHAGRMKTR